MRQQTFSELRLLEPILRAVREQGYRTPTPIQAQAIPPLRKGRDLLGIAQTGTGKTAAFALPILDFLAGDPQPTRPREPSVLVLTPTRELASQIGDCFRDYGRHLKISHTVVFGGVKQGPQVTSLRRGVDVLVATPGRLIDLIEQRHVDLGAVEVFVLDEADRMLDMGFVNDVRRISEDLPDDRQSILFSATMPEAISRLARNLLDDPVRIEVDPPASTVERIDQTVYFVAKSDKRKLLGAILEDPSLERVLVFTRTKHGADRVVRHLRVNGVSSSAIHGNKPQGSRERALREFREGYVRVLVATDIAARGLDVSGITHVVNFDLPNVPESYVHRIGRTARAGRDGVAISFCDAGERDYLKDIEKVTGQTVPVVQDHPFRPTRSRTQERKASSAAAPRKPRGSSQRGRSQRGSSRGGKRHRRGFAKAR